MKTFHALALAVAIGASPVPVAAGAPDDIVTIDVIRDRQAPVPFRHRSHRTHACRMCHHADPRDEGQRCSGCHMKEAEGEMPGLKDAFHRKCMECHRKAKRGPMICTRCHRPAR